MEKNIEATGIIWGLYRDYGDYMGDSGKENGNYHRVQALRFRV